MSTPRHRLPPLPKTIRSLTNDEARALDQRLPAARVSVANCVTCHGQKVFRWRDADGQPAEYDCPCIDQYLLHRWLSFKGILKNYQRLGWGDLSGIPDETLLPPLDYVDKRQAYMDAGIGIVFTGGRGNGKTMLANLLLKRMIAEGEDIYATTFSDMVDNFAGGWQDREQARWFDRTVRNAGVLFIDDLGRERGKGRPGNVGENMLETVVRSRVGSNQPTIITTNLTEDEIHKGYGDHVISLLTERSIIVEVNGADRRDEIRLRTLDEVRLGLTRPVVLS